MLFQNIEGRVKEIAISSIGQTLPSFKESWFKECYKEDDNIQIIIYNYINIYTMKYKGITITEPSLEMFEEFIQETNLPIVAEEVYNHYKKRNWLTKKGTKAKSVEVLCNAWNSIPAHRVGVIQGNAKNKTKNIDWEQRRYEIAKGVMAANLANPDLMAVVTSAEYVVGNECAERLAKVSVRYADALIEELKKDN